LALGVVIVLVRVGFRIVLAGNGPTVLFALPRLTLPEALNATAVGGPVSAEALTSGFYGGLQLAAIVVCVGAATTLANPRTLLTSLPGATEELGAVLAVSVSVFPQLSESVARVGRARALRADSGRRRRVVRQIVTPVLADALDRSIELAAAMDARGYGRRAEQSAAARRATAAVLITAVLVLSVGVYALLDASGSASRAGAGLMVVGVVAAGVGLRLAGRRSIRTRYRPSPWRGPEWIMLSARAAVAVILGWWSSAQPALMHPVPAPHNWPQLPAPLGLAVALAATPLLAASHFPSALAPRRRCQPAGSLPAAASEPPGEGRQ
jgi:energy-coupling factor transport system permease protein